jgi:hypothetical protein
MANAAAKAVKNLATAAGIPNTAPRSLTIAGKGIRTNGDFANLMSALMSDLIEGRVTPRLAAGSAMPAAKLLKVVEMSTNTAPKASRTGAAPSFCRWRMWTEAGDKVGSRRHRRRRPPEVTI